MKYTFQMEIQTSVSVRSEPWRSKFNI